jgi:membrane protease subunit HflC
LKDLARHDYGIEIVDIRLRRFNHPVGVREAIFARIRSERDKKVADYQSEGTRLAEDIKSAAEREARDIKTEAKSQEVRLMKEADIKADEIRNRAHSQDLEFYTFLQKLEAYQRIFTEKTKDVLLLSSRHELFDLLLKPPKPKMPSSPGQPVAGQPPEKPAGPQASKEPAKEGGQ